MDVPIFGTLSRVFGMFCTDRYGFRTLRNRLQFETAYICSRRKRWMRFSRATHRSKEPDQSPLLLSCLGRPNWLSGSMGQMFSLLGAPNEEPTGSPAMEVRFLASGEKLTVLDGEEFQGHSAKTVKQSLAARLGVTRFRQRLFWENGSEIPDHEVFSSNLVAIQLVVLEFWPPDAEQDQEMISAAWTGDSVGLEKLLKCPRDPNVVNIRGLTPLHYAASSGQLEPIRLLLEAGAKLEARTTAASWMAPLHLAARNGRLDVVRVLVEAGAEKDQLATSLGVTPMYFAARQGHLDIVRWLVEAGARIEAAAVVGFAPLHGAAEGGRLDIMRFLLDCGATVDPKESPLSPLYLAALSGHLHIVRLLVESGANYFRTSTNGTSALDVASQQGHVEIVRFLSKLCQLVPVALLPGSAPLQDTYFLSSSDCDAGRASGGAISGKSGHALEDVLNLERLPRLKVLQRAPAV
eukprot:s32_g28.t2